LTGSVNSTSRPSSRRHTSPSPGAYHMRDTYFHARPLELTLASASYTEKCSMVYVHQQDQGNWRGAFKKTYASHSIAN